MQTLKTLCERGAMRCRTELLKMNDCLEKGDGVLYDWRLAPWSSPMTLRDRLVAKVMATRPGLERERVARMVDGIFEAQN